MLLTDQQWKAWWNTDYRRAVLNGLKVAGRSSQKWRTSIARPELTPSFQWSEGWRLDNRGLTANGDLWISSNCRTNLNHSPNLLGSVCCWSLSQLIGRRQGTPLDRLPAHRRANRYQYYLSVKSVTKIDVQYPLQKEGQRWKALVWKKPLDAWIQTSEINKLKDSRLCLL